MKLQQLACNGQRDCGVSKPGQLSANKIDWSARIAKRETFPVICVNCEGMISKSDQLACLCSKKVMLKNNK